MRRLAFILLIAIAQSSIVFAADAESISLMVGRSAVLDTGSPIARVSLTSAEVADAMVTTPSQVLINGKMPGTISLFVWDRGGTLKRYEVTVQRDLARLGEQLTQLFPGEGITAMSNGKSVVLSGTVSHKDVVERASLVASGYVDKKDDVVSLLQVRDSGGSNQVLLRVRFAEVSRSALTELGVNFFTGPNGYKDVLGRVTTQQFPAPAFDSGGDQGKLVFSDFLNFFLWDLKHDLGAVVKALQVKGLFQSLAEPNLVSESGKEASFLAGGEIPVPIAQPSGGGTSVTIMYKEFGIRLNFTPVINGDRVHLKVRPEVSTLDFANGVTLQGFRVPALSTRRTETELELQNGQTFAIAGLINNTMNKSLQKIPGIGDIPVLGYLFRSQAAQKDRSELVVMITPEILPRMSPGVTPALPRISEPFLPPLDQKKSREQPAPAFRPDATGTSQAAAPAAPMAQAPATSTTNESASPAAAAAALQTLTPSQPAETTPIEPRKMTREEQAAVDQARKQEREQQENEKRAQAQAERDNAQREKAAAKQMAKQAELDRKQAKEEEKRAAEEAKKQTELDKKTEKAVAEAQAKLRAAQAAHEAEVAKNKSSKQ